MPRLVRIACISQVRYSAGASACPVHTRSWRRLRKTRLSRGSCAFSSSGGQALGFRLHRDDAMWSFVKRVELVAVDAQKLELVLLQRGLRLFQLSRDMHASCAPLQVGRQSRALVIALDHFVLRVDTGQA